MQQKQQYDQGKFNHLRIENEGISKVIFLYFWLNTLIKT
jgi:hypothetical protein